MPDLDNINAMTGLAYCFDLDIDRGFFSAEVIGQIDAPTYYPVGSTIENVIADGTCAGRYVIANINRR